MEHKRANHPYIGREICSQKDGKAEGTYLVNLPYNIKCQADCSPPYIGANLYPNQAKSLPISVNNLAL
jgi:hypothetical protein